MPLSVTYGLQQTLIKSIPFVGKEREYGRRLACKSQNFRAGKDFDQVWPPTF